MSEFNYTKCSKPFTSQDEARDFMRARSFDGWILRRADGTYTAVCPEYPDGFYPDAVVVEAFPAGAVPEGPSAAAPVADAGFPLATDDGACCAA
jgi:hypothetical protein